MQCQYEYEQNRDECPRKAYPSSNKGFCLLHMNLENKNLNKTRAKFHQLINSGESDFEECVLPSINLSGEKIKQDLQMFNSTVKGSVILDGAVIDGDLTLDSITVDKLLSFPFVKATKSRYNK